MKAKVNVRNFGGEVVVSGDGMATISSSYEDFTVGVEEIRGLEKIKGIYVHPGGQGLSFDFIRDDGWEISIGERAYEGELMVVTKFYRNPKGGVDWDTYQYLTKNGKWKKQPRGGPLPDNAVRIPILAPEK